MRALATLRANLNLVVLFYVPLDDAIYIDDVPSALRPLWQA
jgi:hypothetical protein